LTECVVCQCDLEPDALVMELPCRHAFCVPCIRTWLTQCKNECPLCLAPVTPKGKQALQSDVEFQLIDADNVLKS